MILVLNNFYFLILLIKGRWRRWVDKKNSPTREINELADPTSSWHFIPTRFNKLFNKNPQNRKNFEDYIRGFTVLNGFNCLGRYGSLEDAMTSPYREVYSALCGPMIRLIFGTKNSRDILMEFSLMTQGHGNDILFETVKFVQRLRGFEFAREHWIDEENAVTAKRATVPFILKPFIFVEQPIITASPLISVQNSRIAAVISTTNVSNIEASGSSLVPIPGISVTALVPPQQTHVSSNVLFLQSLKSSLDQLPAKKNMLARISIQKTLYKIMYDK